MKRSKRAPEVRAVLGVDLGTTSVKVVACALDGNPLSSTGATIPLIAQTPLQAEQDPAAWWDATRRAMASCVSELRSVSPNASVEAIGLTGQKHALLPLDIAGVPLSNAFLWADGRAVEEAIEVRNVYPAIRRRSGSHALPGYIIPKWLRWMRAHPVVASETAHLCFAKDWIRYKLSGSFATDRTEASASQIYDFRSNSWATPLVTVFEVPPDALPPVLPSSGRAGVLSEDAADALGLEAGIPIAAGAGDNEAAALAAGAIDDGNVAVILGTSGTVIGWGKRRAPAGGLVWCRHVIPQGYAATGTVLSAGRALNWARHTFFPEGTRMVMALQEAERSLPRGAAPICLSSLVGERSPTPDPLASGCFFGLRPGHTRGHLIRSVLEGVAVQIGDIVRLLRGVGVDVSELRLTSGGAASPLWRRFIAAAADVPVRMFPQARSGPARGAACIAAAMVEGARDLRSWSTQWVNPEALEEPIPAEVSRFQEIGAIQRSVRMALRGVPSAPRE